MTSVTLSRDGDHSGEIHSEINYSGFFLFNGDVPVLERRATQLAIEALLLLALESEGKFCSVRELAVQLDAPATYLAKIVRDLTRLGFLRGMRGPGGGVRLARPATAINLWDVVTALEPVGKFERCVLRPGRCSEQHPCPLHEEWSVIRAQIADLLKSKSLGKLALVAQDRGTLRVKLAAGAP